MAWLKSLQLAGLLLSVGSVVAQSNETEQLHHHRRQVKFDPIRMDHKTFLILIHRLRNLSSTANLSAGCAEWLQVELRGHDGEELVIEGVPSESLLAKAPERTTSGLVWLMCGIKESVPIKAVRFSFNDFERSLVISGSSIDQVEAMKSSLSDLLSRNTTVRSGRPYREWASFVVLSGLLLLLFSRLLATRPREAWTVSLLLASALVWLLPLQRLFPGTLLIAHDLPLLERWTPEIGLLGLLAAIFPKQFFRKLTRRLWA